ncbi:MAG: hydroxymethylglutaryl-CoA lyase [Pseudomonadota bacterium]
MTDRITIVEVGPRDGLQNEPDPIATADKIALIDALSATGLARIEAAAFVSPRAVPQMADGAAVLSGITRSPGIRYSALVPNLRGLESAMAAGVDEIAVFAAASETFSARNINATIAESLARFRPVAEQAQAAGIPLRGYISTVVHCPYEGAVAPAAVARIAEALDSLGAFEISLGDTTGQGTPETIAPMLDAVLDVLPAARLAGHFHDTNGKALESVAVALERGITVFDSAAGGLGGCPFAPGASGNLATGRLIDWAHGQGLSTGVDPAALDQAERQARALSSRLSTSP